MKIAVTHNNGEIFQHFGKSEQFKIYCIENNKIISSEVVDTNGTGHGALAGFLKDHGVEAIICGGIGSGAVNALADAGIKVYGGVSGNADKAAEALAEDKLVYSSEVNCSHHDHSEEHNCGEHDCSSHSCH